jgi:hypothetical protein
MVLESPHDEFRVGRMSRLYDYYLKMFACGRLLVARNALPWVRGSNGHSIVRLETKKARVECGGTLCGWR